MKLVRELRLFVLQDVFHTNRQKHSIVDSITIQKVRAEIFINQTLTNLGLNLRFILEAIFKPLIPKLS